MNHIFLETVIDNGGEINSRLLAMAYRDRYLHPERYYPQRFSDLAKAHMSGFYGVSCGHLGMECPLHPGVPVYALRERSFGCRFPTLIGLLALASAGTLWCGEPEKAYRKAFECAYFDVGYAREACGMLGAAVSLAVAGETDVGKILREVAGLDPFGFTEGPFGRNLAGIVDTAEKLAAEARDARHLVVLLSRELGDRHIYDPVDTLTVCFAANRFAEGDPREALLIAANHRDVDEEDRLVRFRDNDCTAFVAGALAGALSGLSGLPRNWVDSVQSTNGEIYELDIMGNAARYFDTVYPAES